MKYFLIFGERENLNLSKDAKMNFEFAIKTLKRQNQLLKEKGQSGYVQVHLTDLNEELSILFDLELPVENIQEYILKQIQIESEDTNLRNQLKELILDNTQVNESIVIQEKPEIKEKSEEDKPRKPALNIPKLTKPKIKAVSEEEPTNETEKNVELQSQHRQRYKNNLQIQFPNLPIFTIKDFNSKGKWKVIASICVVVLFGLVVAQANKVKILQNNLTTIETTQKYQPSIDILVRYFLPNYFSGNKEQCLDYVSKNVYNNLKIQSADIKSAFAKSVVSSEKEGIYHITYVVLTSKDDKVNSQKISFDVKKISNSKFDFEIVTQPKLTNF